MRLSFRTASLSEKGPRPQNEDTVALWTNGKGILIAVVADGLGGMGAGDTASALAISTLKDYFESVEVSQTSMLEAARQVQTSILAAQSRDPKKATMATTLTAIAFLDDKLIGVHVGDTRAAISRSNGIKKLTVDHSEGQRLFAAGKLSKDELATYPRQHILESALGEPGEPRIDGFEFDILPGDKVMITSDGVHGIVFLREMREMVASTNSPDEACIKLKNAVEKRGPKDNYSAALIFIEAQ